MNSRMRVKTRGLSLQINRTYHLVNVLCDPVTQSCHILLNMIDETLDILRQFLRRHAQLSNSHPHDAQSFSVLTGTDHISDTGADVLDNSASLGTRHEAPWTKNPTQSSLVHFGQRVRMADAPVKLYPAILDSVKDFIFANECGTGLFRCFGGGRLGIADDGDAEVGFDRVRKPYPVADNWTVLESLEADMKFVFGRGWRTADFSCSYVSVFRLLAHGAP